MMLIGGKDTLINKAKLKSRIYIFTNNSKNDAFAVYGRDVSDLDCLFNLFEAEYDLHERSISLYEYAKMKFECERDLTVVELNDIIKFIDQGEC